MGKVDSPRLSAFVVWVPKNGAREPHVGRVLGIVTDPRATQYWDTFGVVSGAYERMLSLTGPCAGIFMLYGPDAQWTEATPPVPDYWEDAHARELKRSGVQFDAGRFAARATEMLAGVSR